MRLLLGISLIIIVALASCTVYKTNNEDTTFDIIGYDPTSTEDFNALVKFIKENPDSEDAYIALQRYIKPEIDKKNWKGAIQKIKNFEQYFPQQISRLQKLQAILNEPESDLKRNKLGIEVNSEYDDYSPVLSVDGKDLYYVSFGRPIGSGGEDIYNSKIEKNAFSQSTNMSYPINSSSHEALTAISTDGTELCIFGNYPAQFQNGNLYRSTLTSKGWTTPVAFPEPINSNFWDGDGFFTPDGRAFIFTSDRMGGTAPYVPKDTRYHGSTWGNTDIYVCEKNDNGWSKPINLGSKINTPYCERKPFLHPDGKTLYFSSEGHIGIGRLDVYKSTRLSETSWTDWSEPENLGKSINTSNDDWGYKITTDGNYAFYAALNSEAANPNLDIYSLALPQKAKPEEVFMISGKVTDENGTPLDADLIWEDVTASKQIGKLKSNPITGEYFLAVPFGKKIGYYATKEGYYETSNYIDLSKKKKTEKVRQDIVLVSIKKMIEEGQSIRMNNIFFDHDKYDLKEESFPELDRLIKILNENKDTKVQISAFTDDLGSDSYNQKLSENRAKSVMDYLITKGIEKNRLKAVGYGKKQPIASNDSEEGRAKNRRVEFKFIK